MCQVPKKPNTSCVIVTPEQMEKSLTARRTAHAISRVTNERKKSAETENRISFAMEPISAAAGAAVTILTLAESIAKLFRPNRRIELANVNEEATAYMKLLLAKQNIPALTIDTNTITRKTAEFLTSLGELQKYHQKAGAHGKDVEKIEAGLWLDKFLEKKKMERKLSKWSLKKWQLSSTWKD